jgi:hypothetical protein
LNEGQPGATVLDHLVGGGVAIGDDERPYGLVPLGVGTPMTAASRTPG